MVFTIQLIRKRLGIGFSITVISVSLLLLLISTKGEQTSCDHLQSHNRNDSEIFFQE